jgi:porphobilinogen synthase
MSSPLAFRQRPRRLRSHPILRDLVAERRLTLGQLIQPYFLTEKKVDREPITGFTDVYRWNVDSLSQRIEKDIEGGVKSFLLFGAAADKDAQGSRAYDAAGIVPEALVALKKRFGEAALLFTDVCLCPYTSHGHCGIWDGHQVANDPSLERLAEMALVHAQAGADFVSPSDMMDGRIGFIRDRLDREGHAEVGILAYTAKFASSYYGPFREALDSTPHGGDRAGYQMDFRNRRDSDRELRLDLEEGADLVMVKPALAYLDIIARYATASDVPVAAYSVSGEYEMVRQMARAGLADLRRLALENLTAIARAGAQVIITYFASLAAEQKWMEG